MTKPRPQAQPTGYQRFQRFILAVEGLSTPVQYAITVTLIAVVFVLDFVTGAEVAFSIFYLMPISLLAWHRGLAAASAGVVVCGLAWLLADNLNAHDYSYPAIRYWNALVRTSFFFVVSLILVQLRRAVNEEQRLARTDALTGAANSRWFLELAALEVAREHRYRHPLSIAFLDCDNFKDVNDRFGHAAGDELLKRIAVCIKKALREVDVVARLGGDEFAVLLPESDARAASIVSGKIRNALQVAIEGHAVTFSIGIVTCYEPPANVEALVHAADLAMYEAKNAGKNATRHRVFGADGARTVEAS